MGACTQERDWPGAREHSCFAKHLQLNALPAIAYLLPPGPSLSQHAGIGHHTSLWQVYLGWLRWPLDSFSPNFECNPIYASEFRLRLEDTLGWSQHVEPQRSAILGDSRTGSPWGTFTTSESSALNVQLAQCAVTG